MAVIALLLLSGCSAVRFDLAGRQLSIEPLSSERVEISRAYVRMAGSRIEIHGTLQARRTTQTMPAGHVVIRVIDSSGAQLTEARTDYHRTTGKLFKKSQQYSFSVTLPSVPPQGSTIRVMFDEAS